MNWRVPAYRSITRATIGLSWFLSAVIDLVHCAHEQRTKRSAVIHFTDGSSGKETMEAAHIKEFCFKMLCRIRQSKWNSSLWQATFYILRPSFPIFCNFWANFVHFSEQLWLNFKFWCGWNWARGVVLKCGGLSHLFNWGEWADYKKGKTHLTQFNSVTVRSKRNDHKFGCFPTRSGSCSPPLLSRESTFLEMSFA